MIGKWILILSVVLAVVGVAIGLFERFDLRLSRLPGDISMRGEGWSFLFPVVTCILVSVVLTVVLNVVVWFGRR